MVRLIANLINRAEESLHTALDRVVTPSAPTERTLQRRIDNLQDSNPRPRSHQRNVISVETPGCCQFACWGTCSQRRKQCECVKAKRACTGCVPVSNYGYYDCRNQVYPLPTGTDGFNPGQGWVRNYVLQPTPRNAPVR